ncbi:MAG: signal recognition particle protein [Planctomycetota bacterium]
MFDQLTDKLSGTLRNLAGRGKISEENVRDAMGDIREALLEADVNYDVTKQFTDAALKKALGQNVLKSLKPADQMVKIVYDELIELMGPVDTQVYTVSPGPTVIMMAGLQGAGKTTTCGKLAAFLKNKKGHQPMLAAVDLQRPAAVQQLRVVGQQVGVPVYTDDAKVAAHGEVAKGAAVSVAKAAVKEAKAQGRDILILDTAGRLAIDEPLMEELADINKAVGPHQIFLVLDAMTGQDAVESAKAFNEKLELDGLILTKFDSDTRGGALLSAKYVTGKPVKFIGTGEKLENLDEFRPEGMAQRILGMGDILGLVQEAQDKFDEEEAARLEAKMAKGDFSLEDFVSQMQQVQKLGPMSKVMGMIPGMSELAKSGAMDGDKVEGHMGRMQAIYNSMTKAERKKPELLDQPRRRRIAAGAGVQVKDVGGMMKQYEMSRGMIRSVGGMGIGSRMKLMKGLMGGGLGGLNTPGGPMLSTKRGTKMQKKKRNKKGKRR